MTTTRDKERWSMKYWIHKDNPSYEIACLISNLQQTLTKKQKALEKLELRIKQLKNIEIKVEELNRVSPV